MMTKHRLEDPNSATLQSLAKTNFAEYLLNPLMLDMTNDKLTNSLPVVVSFLFTFEGPHIETDTNDQFSIITQKIMANTIDRKL